MPSDPSERDLSRPRRDLRMDDLVNSPGWDSYVRSFLSLGRAGTPDDIAHTELYLCSNEGAWVTGQAWIVDGGTTVHH